MTSDDARTLIAHLITLYPRCQPRTNRDGSVTPGAWPVERQRAFAEHLGPIKLDGKQARAVVDHVAMSSRYRTPPESLILDAMRRAARDGGTSPARSGPCWLDVWRARQRKAGARHGYSDDEIVKAEAWAGYSMQFERAESEEHRRLILEAYEHDVDRMKGYASEPALGKSAG